MRLRSEGPVQEIASMQDPASTRILLTVDYGARAVSPVVGSMYVHGVGQYDRHPIHRETWVAGS